MRISFVALVERLAPTGWRARLAASARALDAILAGDGERAASRRVTIFTFLGRLASAAILYLSQVLLARWMGDFEFGVFVVVWVGAVILGSLACLGMHTAVLRFVPEHLARGELPLVRGLLVGSRVQGAVAATLIAAAGVLGLAAFGEALSSYYLIPLYLGAVTLPMLAIAEIQDGMARAFGWADVSLWPTFIVRPLLIIAFMALVVGFGAAPTAVTAMSAVIAATWAASLGQLVWLGRRIKTRVPPGPRRYEPRRWTGIALPIFVLEGFFFLLTNVDVLMVGYLMPPDRAAVYYAAVKTMALVHFIYFAVRAGGAERFAHYHATGDRAGLASFVRDTLHWTFWPSLAMVAMLAAFGAPLLMLFGKSFAAGYPLLLILSVGLLARASIGPAETLLAMAGQQRISALVYTGAFVLNVVLNFELIPMLGLAGAATATTIALAAETVVLYYVTVRRLGIRCSVLDLLKQAPVAPAAV